MDKAEEHTRPAALLAQNMAQSELARRQAATIRTMKREGIERGGYKIRWQVPMPIPAPALDTQTESRRSWPLDLQLDDAAGPSACVVAGHPAAGEQNCRLAVYPLRHSRHPRGIAGRRAAWARAPSICLHLHLFDGGEATGALHAAGAGRRLWS